MPALAFGLNVKSSKGSLKPSVKRKAVFDDVAEEETQPAHQPGAKKSSKPLKPLQPLQDEDDSDDASPRPTKSPKLSHPSPASGLQKKPASDNYTNLSALRTAKLHDVQASSLDSSVYDYDGVYDTFRPANSKSSKSTDSAVPKYMTSLIATTQQRKRDHERAREKTIQREREAEGDEFAGKEQFVTSAYKKQQEENRLAEEEEAKRLEQEEERRRNGVGMMDFRKRMLEREDERMQAIAKAELQNKQQNGKTSKEDPDENDPEENLDKQARDLNSRGARIEVTDDGEVINKRQMLSAGLNAAPKKPSTNADTDRKAAQDSRAAAAKDHRPLHATDSRAAQRERQSRMIERQMESMAEQAAAEEEKEVKEAEEKNKSKISEDAKTGAKERYLARKKEREEEAARKKGGGGGDG